MPKKITVTQNDLLDAIKAALAMDGDGVTSNELMEASGAGPDQVRKFLHALAREGRLEVTKVRRTAVLTGSNILVPAYKIKKAK